MSIEEAKKLLPFKLLLHTCMGTLVYGSPFLCPLEDILDHVSRNIIFFGDLQRPQSEIHTEHVHCDIILYTAHLRDKNFHSMLSSYKIFSGNKKCQAEPLHSLN